MADDLKVCFYCDPGEALVAFRVLAQPEALRRLGGSSIRCAGHAVGISFRPGICGRRLFLRGCDTEADNLVTRRDYGRPETAAQAVRVFSKIIEAIGGAVELRPLAEAEGGTI